MIWNWSGNSFYQMRKAHEEDLALALAWWRREPDEHKKAIWDTIQSEGHPPELEVVLRFAQIGMTHIALEYGNKE